MSAATLPNWVVDLVMQLQHQEDVHPKLYVDTTQGYVQWDWCPAEALKLVPQDVKRYAAAVDAYRSELERDKSPGDDSGRLSV